MKPAPMKTPKHEHWSAELIRIGNLAARAVIAARKDDGSNMFGSILQCSFQAVGVLQQ